MTSLSVFRFGVCSLLGGIFLLLLADALYVPHPPHTNVAVTCPAAAAQPFLPSCAAAALPQPTLSTPASAPTTMLVDIRRSELDRGTSRIASAARIVPTLHNGKPSGVKVYAIRPGSLFATLGVKNGDTLVSINDVKLAAPTAMSSATYKRLSKPHLLDIELRRRGQAHRIVVVVHEDKAS